MSKAFLDTMYLFKCMSRGQRPEVPEEMDIGQVYKLAHRQSVWCIIYPAIKRFCTEGLLKIDSETLSKYEDEYLKIYAFQYRRREYCRELFALLKDNGIDFCLLKGDSLSQFYAEPLLRVSSDVDIKINDTDVDKVIEIFINEGFKIEPLKSGMHHFECTHKLYGLFEVHINYCTEVTRDICFNGEISFDQKNATIDIPNIGVVNILGYDDGLVFLIMHYIKHFISSGAGIRQLMDIAFYIENYGDQISMDNVFKLFDDMGYLKFVRYIMYICSEYLGSDKCTEYAEGALDNQKAIEILEDIESGGVFGYYDASRSDFYKIYLDRRSSEVNVIKKRNKSGVFRKLFPRYDLLSAKYTYLRRCKLLYPVALLQRIIESIKFRANNHPKDINEEAVSRRIEFLNSVGLGW